MPPRHRDRRGRGLRGGLAPAAVPVSRSRSQAFDELVLDAVERLSLRWDDQLRDVEFVVEEVPPPTDAADGPVPLGRSQPASGTRSGRVVVYRRPVERRAAGPRARATLVHDVVVELVGELLGLPPETVDPDYGSD